MKSFFENTLHIAHDGDCPDGERPYSAITRTGIRPVSIRRENTEEHFLI